MTIASPEVDSLSGLDFEFTPQCEHGQHALDSEAHDDGPAKWLQTMDRNLFCGHGLPPLYVCDTWRRYVRTVEWLRCGECGTVGPTDYLTFTPIR